MRKTNINILEEQANRLVLPQSCYIQIAAESDCTKLSEKVKNQLIKWGICIVNLQHVDPDSHILQTVVNLIGTPHRHDGQGRILWDIKPKPIQAHQPQARSHKMSEFVLHTDCSYEKNSPNYFALHVLQHDRMNGGRNLLVDAGTLVQHLSPETIKTLQQHRVRVAVPAEFAKDKKHDYCYIIDKDLNVCFRKEIIEQQYLTAKQRIAIKEFESVAYSPHIARSVCLVKNQILFMDNKRYLHARTKIVDNKRHLRRIRFYMNDIV